MGFSSMLKPPRLISPLRAKQLQRALNNLKLTMICSLLTILVLRGTLGAGKFGTPMKDYEEIKYQFQRIHSIHTRKHASRVLAEVIEERQRPLKAVATQALLSSYAELDDVKLQISDKLQGNHALSDTNFDAAPTIDPSKPYSLGPKVSDWDSQRRNSLRVNAKLVGAPKPRMMLVTGSQPTTCANPEGDHYLLKFVKNKVDYCRLHGIEIFYNLANLDAEMSGFWAKLPLLRKLMLTHPEIEWFWWVDSDAMFTDMAFELPINKYDNYNMVLHGWDDMIYKQKKWAGLNTGSFLIRNCQWSLDMLDAWDKAGKLLAKSLAGCTDSEADNQSTLVYLLTNERDKWGEKVYMENSYYLHGYWNILVGRYEEMMEKNHNKVRGERWPFVTHFVGCKPCKKSITGDYNADLCFKHMERTFNFADNQVLQLYGFQHKSLSSSALQRLRGGSDGLLAPHSIGLVRPLLRRSMFIAQVST